MTRLASLAPVSSDGMEGEGRLIRSKRARKKSWILFLLEY